MSKAPMNRSPRQLLDAALAGEAAAFWELTKAHERTIVAVAFGVLRDPEQAQDVLHDVYVRAFSTLGNLRSPDKVSSWLFSMARNVAHEHLRKVQRDRNFPSNLPMHAVISVPDMLMAEEELTQMEESLRELPETHRIVLGLKYMNNLSCQEIAEALGIGLEAAKSRLFEARRALRARMQAADNKAATHSASTRGEQNVPATGTEKKVL